MKGTRIQIAITLLLSVYAWGQASSSAPATVRAIHVRRAGNRVEIEISLSAAIQASAEKASGPDRVIVALPGVVSSTKQERKTLNFLGVRDVRYGLHSANPPETRLVVDMDSAHPYTLAAAGSRIVLTLEAPQPVARREGGAPAAAASGGFIGIFRRKQNASSTMSASAQSLPLPPPPPSQPPIAIPENGTRASAGAGTAPATPTASHPDKASLQEGTVFPGLGSPGAGTVPASQPTTGGYPTASTPVTTANPSGTTPAGTTFPAAISQAASPHQASSSQLVVEQTATLQASTTSSQAAEAAPKPPHAEPVPPNSIPKPPAGAAGQAAVLQETPSSPQETQGDATTSVTTVADSSPAAKTAEKAAISTSAQTVPSTVSDSGLVTVFKVKYVAQGVAYLEGGRSAGLAEGMKLLIKDDNLPSEQGSTVDPNDPRVVAELQVTGVAESSSVTDIHESKREVKPGDLAYLSAQDAAALVAQRSLSATRVYPAVITFTEGDPMDEEARAEIPRPPLPSVNRARGRIGLDYMGTVSRGVSTVGSSDVGMVLRADITRINGTYWNLSGYWRGRLESHSSTGTQTLQDLINRTYHLSFSYDNPNSAWVAGVGRLYLPWASSLDTIDGGYFGRRLNPVATAGIFAGSTPDPTSWDYSPDRRIAGAFVNFQGGTFDDFHYTSTSGLGLSTLNWQIDRPFVFFENAIFYKRYLSIFHSLQADSPRGNAVVPAPGPGLSRSFLTVRLQPWTRVEFDFNHNYFRDIPTFDASLIGTGLLDKYLFQGASIGTRVEVVKQVFAYVNVGRSTRSGDTSSSWNQLYGLTFNRLPWLNLRADAHYSRFASSFGEGSYRSFSLSRNFGEGFRLEMLLGSQRFTSSLAGADNARFITGNMDWSFGSHYFMQSTFTANRGGALSYDQWMLTWGYRFDNRSKSRK